MMRILRSQWRVLAIAAALVASYGLGHRSGSRSSTATWRDTVTVVRQHGDSAVAALRRELAASDAARPDLDSARTAWRALRGAPRVVHDTIRTMAAVAHPDPARTALDAALAHADTASPAQLAAAGDRLERACTAYESACEIAKRQAAAAIDSLEHLITLLDHPPPNPAAARLEVFGVAGYSPLEGWPLLAADVQLRVLGPWYVGGELTQPLAPHAGARGAIVLMRRF